MLRSSISNTRKFFQKTLENFKSFFSNGYQKLPKNPNSCNLTLYNFHKPKNNNPNTTISKSSPSSSLQKPFHAKPISSPSVMTHTKSTRTTHQRKADDDEETATKVQLVRRGSRERTSRFPVAEKLREIENLMGIKSDDHFTDVQEFLHYYSRLNCPVYIDIVEQFFVEMYAEFFESPSPMPIEQPRNAVSSRRRRIIGPYRGYKQ